MGSVVEIVVGPPLRNGQHVKVINGQWIHARTLWFAMGVQFDKAMKDFEVYIHRQVKGCGSSRNLIAKDDLPEVFRAHGCWSAVQIAQALKYFEFASSGGRPRAPPPPPTA